MTFKIGKSIKRIALASLWSFSIAIIINIIIIIIIGGAVLKVVFIVITNNEWRKKCAPLISALINKKNKKAFFHFLLQKHLSKWKAKVKAINHYRLHTKVVVKNNSNRLKQTQNRLFQREEKLPKNDIDWLNAIAALVLMAVSFVNIWRKNKSSTVVKN